MLNLLLTAQLPLRDAPVGREREFRRPQLPHFIAAIDPDEIIPRREIGQLEAQRRGVFALRQRFNALHGIAFHRQGLLLRFIAAQDEEQIAAIVLVEVIPGAVFHGQVIGRDHDDRVFEIE